MLTSEIAQFLVLTSVVVWILPPFRQYKGYLFDFFLVLAVIDPLTLVYGLITRTSMPLWLISLFIYLLIISIVTEEYLRKLKYLFILFPLAFVFVIPYMKIKHYHILFVIMESIVLFVFLKWLITSYVECKKVKIFYLVLVFYTLTVILKFFNFLNGFADASQFFIITSIAQIIFGLYFSIFREDRAGITS